MITKIVSDPTDTLEAGEVHIKSSSRNLLDMNGEYTDLIVGPVLVKCLLQYFVQE